MVSLPPVSTQYSSLGESLSQSYEYDLTAQPTPRYVSEHRSRGLEMSLVSSTMALLTTFNSLLAISAGLVSDLMVRQLELPVLAPFLAAIPCLGLSCLLMSGLWTENYGSQAPVLSNYRQGCNVVITAGTSALLTSNSSQAGGLSGTTVRSSSSASSSPVWSPPCSSSSIFGHQHCQR